MSSGFKWGFAGVEMILDWSSPYLETGLFPQIKVLDSDGSVQDTINLAVNATLDYVYEGAWTPPSEGEFRAYCVVYPSSADRTANTNAREDLSLTDVTIRVRKIPTDTIASLGGGSGVSSSEIKKILKDIVKEVWEYKIDNQPTGKILSTRS